jgi:O-antigen ligase
MPIGMAVAHRSSPVFLAVSTLLALIGIAREGSAGDLVRQIGRALDRPLGIASLAFFVFTVVSLSWSAFPTMTLGALGEFWLPVACAFVLGLVLPGRSPPSAPISFGIALAVACGLILADLATNLAWRQALGMRSAAYIFNRPVLTIFLGTLPVIAFLAPRGRRAGLAAAALSALALFTISRSESGAAELGVVAAALAAGAALVAPRATPTALGAALVAALAIAPWHGVLGDRLIPNAVHSELAQSHSRDRIEIWRSFGDAIRVAPLFGGGFGVSPAMAQTPTAAQVSETRRVLLGVGHPHSAAVQIWAELGLAGALLAGAVLFLAAQRLRELPPHLLAPGAALIAGAVAVALVGHGAWQGWWAAAIGAALVWLRVVARPETLR